MKRLAKYSDHAYGLMRVAAGFLFGFHGAQKVFGLLSEYRPAVGSQIWIGGLLELAGGLAILLGFRTRLFAFICSGEMAVAYVQYHWKLQLGPKLLPAVNQGELALLYAFVFLYMACRGSVKWSLDRE
ncbi:MAG: DoxX family protein [bacterium]|nr:DoxX family protein [bacterium]